MSNCEETFVTEDGRHVEKLEVIHDLVRDATTQAWQHSAGEATGELSQDNLYARDAPSETHVTWKKSRANSYISVEILNTISITGEQVNSSHFNSLSNTMTQEFGFPGDHSIAVSSHSFVFTKCAPKKESWIKKLFS